MSSTLHPVLAGKLFYVRLLAGKKIADLGMLVKLSLVPLRWIETRNKIQLYVWCCIQRNEFQNLMRFLKSCWLQANVPVAKNMMNVLVLVLYLCFPQLSIVVYAAYVYRVIIVRLTVMHVYCAMLMITGIYICSLISKGWNQW